MKSRAWKGHWKHSWFINICKILLYCLVEGVLGKKKQAQDFKGFFPKMMWVMTWSYIRKVTETESHFIVKTNSKMGDWVSSRDSESLFSVLFHNHCENLCTCCFRICFYGLLIMACIFLLGLLSYEAIL